MNRGVHRTVTELPVPDGWDFGDFPYGLEPLTLPEPPTSEAGHDIPDVLPADESLVDRSTVCRRTGAPLSTTDFSHQLFWFRWITGHQATFAVWQLTAHALYQARTRTDPTPSLRVMTDLTDAYTSMLLYTSSCPADVYGTVIRPSMYLQHRSFSGTWAPDFVPVRGLLRGKKTEWGGTPEGQAFKHAVQMYHTVHAGVAAKLVPGGRSLLQESATETTPTRPETQALLYDHYFLTLRTPVGAVELVDQLRSRLRAISLDVATNGLYPGLTPEEDAAFPDELRSSEVRRYERGFHAALSRIDVAARQLKPKVLHSTAP
ncbi:hypothetical protein [Streptomyces sp. NBC_01285]|uniref:hypothetical protein n=1 Tax=Streptomyces sp. NBC_01285 TaxID=2903813 RepID=UPI00225828A0|nr:hypothetical protein [Streptomyces sp. NBC_01285]MCX4774407.1 hypothetical protein [Streptomyces sp. NBC_01285]